MASIERRGDSFRIKVYTGETSEGKKQFKTMTYKPKATTAKKIEKEVQAVANDFENKVRSGECFDQKMTVERFYREHWLPDFSYKLSPRERENALANIERIFLPEIGHLKINEVRAYHIQAIINKLEKDGYKPRTTAKFYSQFRPIITTAFQLEVISHNPCDRVTLPKIEKTEAEAFSAKQVQIFLDLALNGITIHHPEKIGKNGKTYKARTETVGGSIQFYALFSLAIYGGFRRGELLALKWNDIDFATGCVNVDKAVSTSKATEGRYEKDPKTKAGFRTVDIPFHVLETLRMWKLEQLDIARNLGTAWKGNSVSDFENQVIFIQENGLPMDLSTPNHKMKDLIAIHNQTAPDSERLPELHFHCLRHTNGSQLVQAGIDIATVAKRLGHSDLRVLLNVYTHSTEKELDRKASDALEKAFSQPSAKNDGELLGNYGELN